MTLYSLDVLLSQFGNSLVLCPVLTIASWPEYSFLSRKVRWWYPHLFKNFPQFVVIHTKALVRSMKQMFFWNSVAFSMTQPMLAIWSLVPLPFLNPAWTSGNSQFILLLKRGLENFEHYFASLWDDCNCAVVWTFFGIVFLWDWNENWPFPVLWPLLSFPNLLAYWVQHLYSIIFQDLK